MKTRQEFLTSFLKRLEQRGFTVEPTHESDIAAECYLDGNLFCVVTQDGDIIYEDYNADAERQIKQSVSEARNALKFCSESPLKNLTQMPTVSLTRGAYYKLFESSDIALLCRYSELFGYEFVVCHKTHGRHASRQYYRERLYHNLTEAQDSFMVDSGLKSDHIPIFNQQELSLLLFCATRCVCVDNELDGDMEHQIKDMIAKLENSLPEQGDFSPRQFYRDERV